MKTKITVSLLVTASFLFNATIANAQTPWYISGNAGTNPPTDFIGTTNKKSLLFKTGNQEQMEIDTNGHVGIAITSTPIIYPLTVYTHQQVSGGTLNSGGNFNVGIFYEGLAAIGSQSTTNHAVFGSPAANKDVIFCNNNGSGYNERMRITSAGDIGIGLTAPASSLHSAGQIRTGIPSGGLGGATATTGSFLFYNSSNTNTVNVQSGITTTSYTMTLPLAQGAASTVLTNNGTGVLSWAANNGTGWSLAGNSGTTPGTNFIGTIDAQDFVVRTTNTERMRVLAGGNVGIGTTTPTSMLQVYSNSVASNEKLANFERVGSTGSAYISVMAGARSFDFEQNGGGGAPYRYGTYVDGNIVNNYAGSSGAYGNINFVTGNAGGSAIAMTIGGGTQKGNVGIGTTSPARPLHVVGQIRTDNDNPEKPTGGAWVTISDQRLKKDVAPFKDGLTTLRQVNPVTFKFNGIGNLAATETHIGVIAQEIQPVAPYCVLTGTGRLIVKQSESVNFSGSEIIETLPPDSLGEVHTVVSPLNYTYDGLIYVMINSIKQLDSTNTELLKKDSILVKNDSVKDAEIQALQNLTTLYDTKFQQMQNRINQLDSMINSCCSLGSTRSMQLNSDSQISETQVPNSKDVELVNRQVVVLFQNSPNPFKEQTTIEYYLPDNVQRAQIIFMEQSGKLIKTVDLTEKGKGVLNVFANDLTNGTYLYSLIIDGQTIETKKMVKTK